MDSRLEYLKRIDTGIVTDAMGLLGIEGWTNSIFPINREAKIVGRAFTAMYTASKGSDEKGYTTYDVIDMCEPGDILVITGAPEGRVFGGNVAYAAYNKGLSGVVLDGRTRDVLEISNVPIEVFYRGPIMRSTDNSYKLTLVNVTVNCDGACIKPGDIVVGDFDGVLVIPQERLDDVIYQCEMIEQVEKEMAQALRNKVSIAEAKAIIKKKKVLRP